MRASPSNRRCASIDSRKGNSQETVGNIHDAIQTYESMLPYVSTTQSTSASSAEHCYWTERLLARHCLLTSRHVKLKAEKTQQNLSPEATLAPFRAWADFWGTRLSGEGERIRGQDSRGEVSRRRIWQAYYNTLSTLLQQGSSYPYPSEKPSVTEKTLSAYDNKFLANPRLQQITELKKVEAIYEGLLLKEVKFPKASEGSPEIESWAGQVMANWRIFSGSTWKDDDIGDGGKESLGRNILDVHQSYISSSPKRYHFQDSKIDTDRDATTDPLPCSYKKLPQHSNTAIPLHRTCLASGL